MTCDYIFAFPSEPHIRKHGPAGYSDYQPLKRWLRDEFSFRCVYCLEREQFSSDGHNRFAADHVVAKEGPKAQQLSEADKEDLRKNYDNLVYSCTRCNSFKSTKEILDPCKVSFADHIRYEGNGNFCALTPEGQDLIDGLHLNEPRRVEWRKMIMRLCEAASAQSAAQELKEIAKTYFKYPDDLPNLRGMRPESNKRPEGIENCFFEQHKRKELPERY